MSNKIKKVGIIGAGTMGSGIAAHLANIGIPSVLLDIPTSGLSGDDDTRANRNKHVQAAFKRMLKMKPANLGSSARQSYITVGNTQDDFELLADCDWIVEVIIEKLAPKQQLMAQLEAVCKKTAIVTSNTSGIPIGAIADGRSDSFKRRFLGTHFFNPVRYLRLLEIIPTADTDQDVTDFMMKFGTNVLGKGVVLAKDRPNFIGNRLLSMTGAFSVEYALQNGYSIAEVDNLTGPLIGRPKTGTFRLSDVVGIDVMQYVNANLYPAIPNDKYRDILHGEKSTVFNQFLLENQLLGNKTGKGFWKKSKDEAGKRIFLTLDPDTKEYVLPPKVRFDSVGAVRKMEDTGERINALLAYSDRGADYVRHVLYYMFQYAAYTAQDISYSLADIDKALVWGFAHEMGPFAIWDALGVADTVNQMEQLGYEVAEWVKTMLAAGRSSFYATDGTVYDWTTEAPKPLPTDILVLKADSCDLVARVGTAQLRDMGDGILLFEKTGKMNTIDPDVIKFGRQALIRLQKSFDAMVIGNDANDFSVGANLQVIAMAAMGGQWKQIETIVHDGQKLFMDMRHFEKPIVTAPQGRVLGGGVEMVLGGWQSVANHETYMGLVEVGVGLIPGWGGCKEQLRRRVNPIMKTKNGDPFPIMQAIFEQLAMAKVAESAYQAKEMGYLLPDDLIVFNGEHRLRKAKDVALGLVQSGASAPPYEKVYAAGRDVYYLLKMGLKSFEWGGYATPHDMVVGDKLAAVLCGGDLSSGQWVDPWYILDLEREALLSLAGTTGTKARVEHMLMTGKPLRN